MNSKRVHRNLAERRKTKKVDLITHLEELRKRILVSLLFVVSAAVAAFFFGDTLMALVKKPIHGVVDELIFITPPEAFTAYLKISLLSGFIASFPIILYQVWAFLSPALDKDVKKRFVLWLIFSCILFFLGMAFSYYLAIPAALKFLIGFGENIAVAKISLGKYISFVGALIIAGGVIFELPAAIGLIADAGFVRVVTLKRKRHYAILAIFIFAAIITPTQDILNMLILAVPMMLLYEIGILLASFIESRRHSSI